jgi:hypothetical protein
MGRVLLGAVILAVIGGVIGGLPNYYDAVIDQPLVGPQGQIGTRSVSYAHLCQTLGMLIGAGSSAVVGAIAGYASGKTEFKPIPWWFWAGLGAVIVVAALFFSLVSLTPRSLPEPTPKFPREQQVGPKPVEKAAEPEVKP